MQKSGKVIEKTGDEVTIEFKRTSACGNCKACKTFEDASYATIHIKTKSDAEIGDTVDINMSSKQFVLSVLILYGLPLVALIVGALVGTFISDAFDLDYEGIIAFGMAILFMCVTLFFMRFIKTIV